jgi:hypothetical protein
MSGGYALTPVTQAGLAGLDSPWNWSQRGAALTALDMTMDNITTAPDQEKAKASAREVLFKPIGPGWEVGPGPEAYLREVLWHTQYMALGFDLPGYYNPVRDPGMVGENYQYDDFSRFGAYISGPDMKQMERHSTDYEYVLSAFKGSGAPPNVVPFNNYFRYTTPYSSELKNATTAEQGATAYTKLVQHELETVRKLSSLKPSEIVSSNRQYIPLYWDLNKWSDHWGSQVGGTGTNNIFPLKQEYRDLSYVEFQQLWQQKSLDLDRLLGTNLGNQKTRMQNENRNIMDDFARKYDTRKNPTLDKRRGASGGGVGPSVTKLSGGQQRGRVSSVTLLG